MRTKSKTLSPHSEKILALLTKNGKPLSAYDILERVRRFGIKAPQTVYRALEPLVARGLVHRIESLNAFIACHGDGHGHTHEANYAARFAICRDCGTVEEICDSRVSKIMRDVGKSMKFIVEREMLELLGLCARCGPGKTGGEGRI